MIQLHLLICAWLLSSTAAGAQPALSPAGTIVLPDVKGRIDHLAYDPSSHRVFVAALGNDTVEIVDLAAGTRVRTITGFHEPQGIAFVPPLKLAAVAGGEDGMLSLLSPEGRVARSIRVGEDADNVRWDAGAGRLYVGYGSGALAAIDPARGVVDRSIRLPGHPESFQLEAAGPRIFVNVPGAASLVVVDRTTGKVVASWPVRSARANYPLALDEAGHRLFIGCRQPARVLVYDSTEGRELLSFDTVADTDDLFFDAVRQRLYVSGGEGFVDVIDTRAGGRYPRTARFPTAAGARTSLFLPAVNELLVAVPRRDGHGAQLRVFAVQ